MARFNDTWMDTLLMKSDIVSIVSSYVSLKSKGRSMWGLCPFHSEKTPSFSVNADKQLFYCFGCGAGGGVVQFVMQIERLQFTEAVELLAHRAGMELPAAFDDEQIRRERAHKERLFDACKKAAKYYHERLLSAEGDEAKRYLLRRGLEISVVKRFGLGFAPETWNGLKDYLLEEGFTNEELLDSGLVNSKSGRVYDAYRNRVIFPIIGTDARVMGFGARSMGDDLPKYINTSDTPIYNKRRSLYALNSAKAEKTPDIVIVEGYMDVISLYATGIKNAVASLGTSLTVQQARLVKRYAQTVYIAYDGDAAGQNATLRGLDILQGEGINVKVVIMPEDKDPDDFVRAYGKEEFLKLKEKAVTLNEFKLSRMAEKYDLSTEDGRQDYAVEGCRFLASIQPVEQERHIARLARDTGLPVETLRSQVSRENGKPLVSEPRMVHGSRERRNGDMSERRLLEQSLLRAATEAPEHVNLIKAHGVDKLFTDEAMKSFAKMLIESEKPDIAHIMSSLETEQANVIAQALGREEKIMNPGQYINDCITRILRTETMAEIEILQAQTNNDAIPFEERLELITRIAELKKHL